MNILLTEDQHDRLKKYEFYKKMFYRYWDKMGPGYDDTFLQVFETEKNGFYEWQVEQLLMEYIGKEEALKQSFEFLKGTHKIQDCGTYKFNFDITKSVLSNDPFGIVVNIEVNTKEGTVVIMGDDMKLSDALDDQALFRDVEEEIGQCIWEYLVTNVSRKFGIEVKINKLIERNILIYP